MDKARIDNNRRWHQYGMSFTESHILDDTDIYKIFASLIVIYLYDIDDGGVLCGSH